MKLIEPECYPNTRVFVNRLNISDSKRLAEVETSLSELRTIELLQKPGLVQQTFDFEHLSAIHRYLFGDLFTWAGSFRSYDMRKQGSEFTSPSDFVHYARQIAAEISNDHYPSLVDLDGIAQKTARHLGRINAIHPFPEGNGRAQRIFISHLLSQTPYRPDWGKVRSWEMIAVCVNVMTLPPEERFDSMAAMLKRILVKP